MILEQGAPGLRGWFAAPCHVLADASLADVDAEFEQFTVNTRCTPRGVLPGTSDGLGLGSRGQALAVGLSVSELPSPNQAKPLTMPAMTVSGFTSTKVERQSRSGPTRETQKRQSAEVNFDRFLSKR